MRWLLKFLTSSIGQKLVMSLTGIFLILFLVVHLGGNLQLLYNDGGMAFNEYAETMANNPLIQTISKGNFFFILLHAFIGLYLWAQNRSARGTGYAVKKTKAVNTNAGFAKNMAVLGTIILVFILIHLWQFWFKMKFAGESDLYQLVKATFTDLPFVAFYVLSMLVISFHLWHGFQSAFQTLGINHQKYSPLIRGLGKLYAVAIPLGFAIIPIVFYLKNAA